jgi:hypothetical protein
MSLFEYWMSVFQFFWSPLIVIILLAIIMIVGIGLVTGGIDALPYYDESQLKIWLLIIVGGLLIIGSITFAIGFIMWGTSIGLDNPFSWNVSEPEPIRFIDGYGNVD